MRPMGARSLLVLIAALVLGPVAATRAAEPHGIAVIVAHGAGPSEMERRTLALIYQRKMRFWEGGGRIAPANLPANHPVRRAFSQAVLGHTPEELDDYWRDQYFHGELPPFVASSEEAMIRFVAATPGAIGYVSECLTDKRVNVVMVIPDGPPCAR